MFASNGLHRLKPVSEKFAVFKFHEHIHMLPLLFPLTLELASAYNIPHVRLTQANGLRLLEPRTGSQYLMQAMHAVNRPRLKSTIADILGLSRSGKLDFDYLEMIFSKLKPGKTMS